MQTAIKAGLFFPGNLPVTPCRDDLLGHGWAAVQAVAAVELQPDRLPHRHILLAQRRDDPLAIQALDGEAVHFYLLLEGQTILEARRVFLGKVAEEIGRPSVLLSRRRQTHRACP